MHKTKPLVSTITSCYKMQNYLPLFLDWLPKQTFFNYIEVVLDHNEPTEEEILLIKKFQKKYPGKIKHLIVDKVVPIYVSWNRCIQNSSGEFLAIWNMDDLRTPDSIEQQARILIKEPDVDFVYGNYKIVNKFGSMEGKLIEHSKFIESDLRRGMILGPFFMFRKKILERSGFFDEQLKSGADYDFAVRLALNGKAAKVNGELGYYLDEGKGASTRPGSLQPIERMVIDLRYFIWDKVDEAYFDKALRYNIHQLKIGNKWMNISRFIPNYESFALEQQKLWEPAQVRQEKKRHERRRRKIGHLLYKLGLHGPVKLMLNKFRVEK